MINLKLKWIFLDSQKDQVKIKLDNGLLEVSANKEESAETNTEKKYIRKERRVSSVSRSFRVGSGVSEDEITAKMEHGVLTIEVPKKEKEADTFSNSIISK